MKINPKQQFIYLEDTWYSWKNKPTTGVLHQIVSHVKYITDAQGKEFLEFKNSDGEIFYSDKTRCLIENTPDNHHKLGSIVFYQHQIDRILSELQKI